MNEWMMVILFYIQERQWQHKPSTGGRVSGLVFSFFPFDFLPQLQTLWFPPPYSTGRGNSIIYRTAFFRSTRRLRTWINCVYLDDRREDNELDDDVEEEREEGDFEMRWVDHDVTVVVVFPLNELVERVMYIIVIRVKLKNDQHFYCFPPFFKLNDGTLLFFILFFFFFKKSEL